MQRRILSFLITGFLFLSLLNVGCNKLDTTDIGGDILPAVDNIHTFADTLSIITTQAVFSPDTTVVSRTEDHAVGHIVDPLYNETTNALAAFQLKPPYFPYAVGNPNDTISSFPGDPTGFDSAVLCIKLKGYYGDTSQPLQLDVREVVDQSFATNVNQPNPVSYAPTLGNTLGTVTITSISHILNDTVHYINNKDYSIGVIRIRMPDGWGRTLFNQDSFKFHTGVNAFASDSIYRRSYNGLALVPHGGTGNSLIYVNLADATTRLELHYRRQNNGVKDTVFNSMVLNSDFFGTQTLRSSNTVNNIVRNRAGALPSGDQEIYLETNPGTYANLKIPGLTGMTNRIIHRAELIVEQIPDPAQTIFKAPNYLYLDLKDSGSTNKWKPLYFDLNTAATYDPDYKNPFSIPYFPSSGIDYLYYGGFRRDKTDQFGNAISYYNFNVTKYVQDIVTNHRYNYDMRLHAPFSFSYPQYSGTTYPYGNSIAYGRVKVGGGNNPNYRMRMRIVYSTL